MLNAEINKFDFKIMKLDTNIDLKGSIELGKYADMTVLSDDIFTMPKENLKDVKPLKTIVGGKIVYEAK